MAVNVTPIIDNINTILTSGSITDDQAAQFNYINSNLSNCMSTYTSTSSFPPAANNTGRFVLNTADGYIYFSDGTTWSSTPNLTGLV